MKKIETSDLTALQREALHQAARVRELAYSPYSRMLVGACLYRDNDKLMVVGCNFENALFKLSICAEKAAIINANSIGQRQFDGIVISTRHLNFDTTEATFPCETCWQFLLELCKISGEKIEIISATTNCTTIIKSVMYEVMPLEFEPPQGPINEFYSANLTP